MSWGKRKKGIRPGSPKGVKKTPKPVAVKIVPPVLNAQDLAALENMRDREIARGRKRRPQTAEPITWDDRNAWDWYPKNSDNPR